MRYGIHWDVVAAIPLIAGLLLADHLGQARKRKTREERRLEKEELKAAKAAEELKTVKIANSRNPFRKRKSGFRTMKSNAQRIRERAARQAETGTLAE